VASWKWRNVRRALLEKGFRLERSTNHEYYRLYVDGRASSIRTKVSHGSKGELNANSPLMRKYQGQLRLEKQRVQELFDCPLSGAEYARLLKDKGIIET